jgi:hypothetical protein
LRPLQDDDDKVNSDSDTSGKFNADRRRGKTSTSLPGVVDEEPEQPPQQIRRNESKKRGRYTHPTESNEDRSEANTRILEALQQVRKSAQSDREGKGDSVTLYVGNLEYNTSEQNLR